MQFILSGLLVSAFASIVCGGLGVYYAALGSWWLALVQAVVTAPNLYFTWYWIQRLRTERALAR